MNYFIDDMLFRYIKEKLARRKARRIFKEYPFEIQNFQLEKEGSVQFANWKNPLMKDFILTQKHVDSFRRFIAEGSLAIDIGTNIGDTTVPMALAAGKNGLVLGFEPNPHIAKIAIANAGLNKDKTTIEVLPYAIAEKEAEFYYSSSEASLSNGGISHQPNSIHGSYTLPFKIQAVNLENFLEHNYPGWLSKLSFIKIDTEGYDMEIIQSIQSLLNKYKPVVEAECFSKLTSQQRNDLYDCIVKQGYEIYYFDDLGNADSEQKLSQADMHKWKHFNFYAVPKKSSK